MTRIGQRSMRWVLREAFVFFVVIGLASPAGAVIYKWKDDSGKTHFTDNLEKVPPRFREKDKLEKVRPAPPSGSSDTPAPEKADETAPPSGETPPAGEKSQELSAQETDAINASIKFLESDLKRFEKFVAKGEMDVNVTLVVRDAIPEKTALANKLEKFDLPGLKAAAKYLQSSLKQDEDAKEIHHDLYWRKMRANDHLKRVTQEAGTKTGLIKQLKASLEADAEAKKKAQQEKMEQGKEKTGSENPPGTQDPGKGGAVQPQGSPE